MTPNPIGQKCEIWFANGDVLCGVCSSVILGVDTVTVVLGKSVMHDGGRIPRNARADKCLGTVTEYWHNER